MRSKALFLFPVLAFLSLSAQAAWELTGLTYNGYCPPAALQAKLCRTGESFVADDFILRPANVGAFVVNKMVEVSGLTADTTDLLLGSRIKVTWVVGDRVRTHQYLLMDRWLDLEIDDLYTRVLNVTNVLGKTFTATVNAEGNSIEIRGMFTEPSDSGLPRNVARDATMTFTNGDCQQ